MIIVVDGIDKAGKSTLIDNLKGRLDHGLTIKLLDKPKDNSAIERQKIKTHYMEMLELTREDYFVFVMDRWYTSELAYSFKRGYEALDDDWFQEFDAKVASFPNLFCLVEADYSVVRERFVKDHEDFAKIEEISKIQNRYRQVLSWTKMNKLVLNTTDNLEGSVAKLLRVVNKIDRQRIADGRSF